MCPESQIQRSLWVGRSQSEARSGQKHRTLTEKIIKTNRAMVVTQPVVGIPYKHRV
jgi:hypothetical protein